MLSNISVAAVYPYFLYSLFAGVATFMTCLLAVYVFDYHWDWIVGMMFGAVISATDPVAVVALLKDLGE